MRIGVVGSGIAGLSSAWLLGQRHQVTLFEANDYLGGHAHTVDVELQGQQFPVDTGFLIFNHQTYPHLTALFDHLKVATHPSNMSFSVSIDQPQLEWAGHNLATLFAQRRNVFRPTFIHMLADMLRFNKEVPAELTAGTSISLGAFLDQRGYSAAFRNWYLLPMTAAIWSCPTKQMLDYPLASFARFFVNHGLLQIHNRPQWHTVSAGSREYVRRMAMELTDVRLQTPVWAIARDEDGIWISTARGGREHYDKLVFACHPDQALRILGSQASSAEQEILGTIRYQPNRVVLHTDPRLLPKRRKLWSAWNYAASNLQDQQAPVCVNYWLNAIQSLPTQTPVILSLNPVHEPQAQHVLAEYQYDHPMFNTAALKAQSQLCVLQGWQHTWYCGAWTGYGFHEDGLRSALALAQAFDVQAPWQAAQSMPSLTEIAA